MIRFLALVLIPVCCITLLGCQTTKKAGKGAAEGVQEDWQSSCKGIKAADSWIKKNFW